MFGSKRALIRLQIAAWHHRKRETASDRGVVPPERWKNTSQGTCRDWGGEKNSRSFAGKTVWRADGDKNPQKRYVQGSDGRTR